MVGKRPRPSYVCSKGEQHVKFESNSNTPIVCCSVLCSKISAISVRKKYIITVKGKQVK